MKTTLSALIYLALVSTTVPTQDIPLSDVLRSDIPVPQSPSLGFAWLGEWTPTQSRMVIETRAINCGLVKTFRKIEGINGVLLVNEGSEDHSGHVPDPICGHTIGIELMGVDTFCGLYLIGFINDGDDDVLMVLRFLGLNESDQEYRLEIPLFEVTAEEANDGISFTFTRDDWYERVGIDSPIEDTLPFHFEWLECLLEYGVIPTFDPLPMEGDEEATYTFVTLPVLLPPNAMAKLRTAV